jgi:uncharacterized membrane protein
VNWWWPLHSWHPVVVHLPLVGLLFAVVFDLAAAQRRSTRWRDAATALWWIGFLGAAAAITTGLIAYNRVEHSDAGHEEMVLHRNIALISVGVLLITAAWRWRRSYSRGAAFLGLIGALGLAGAGYLGGDLVYRHGLGIPTAVLQQVARERGPDAHEHPEDRAPSDTSPDTTKAHTHPDTTQPHMH